MVNTALTDSHRQRIGVHLAKRKRNAASTHQQRYSKVVAQYPPLIICKFDNAKRLKSQNCPVLMHQTMKPY